MCECVLSSVCVCAVVEGTSDGTNTVKVVWYCEELLFLYVFICVGHICALALACNDLFSTIFSPLPVSLCVHISGVLGTLYQCTDSFNYPLLVSTQNVRAR